MNLHTLKGHALVAFAAVAVMGSGLSAQARQPQNAPRATTQQTTEASPEMKTAIITATIELIQQMRVSGEVESTASGKLSDDKKKVTVIEKKLHAQAIKVREDLRKKGQLQEAAQIRPLIAEGIQQEAELNKKQEARIQKVVEKAALAVIEDSRKSGKISDKARWWDEMDKAKVFEATKDIRDQVRAAVFSKIREDLHEQRAPQELTKLILRQIDAAIRAEAQSKDPKALDAPAKKEKFIPPRNFNKKR